MFIVQSCVVWISHALDQYSSNAAVVILPISVSEVIPCSGEKTQYSWGLLESLPSSSVRSRASLRISTRIRVIGCE